MRIAIVGSGISGLTAAYLLYPRHNVTVYEAADYVGGHTATVDIRVNDQQLAVDTGFIVFNDWTYPNFIKLMHRLGVPSKPTDMGFSVTTRHGDGVKQGMEFEYCGSTLGSLFADRRQLASPAFLAMLKDIVLFNRRARRDLAAGNIQPQQTISAYLEGSGYGDYFFRYYLNPMASAIWSTPTSQVGSFNALFFLRFYRNHGLLNITNRPQWRVIKGGSRSYVKALTAGFHDTIRVGDAAQTVGRGGGRVKVTSNSGEETYDQVIFACHSDQALRLLESPSAGEQRILRAIPYCENSVVLHTDERLLPRRRRAWTSWNYLVDGRESERPVLTYNMNILQGLETDTPVCVTVNGDAHIDPSRVIQRFRYAHPQFGTDTVAAQQARDEINGVNNTWFCGAYWGNGFHEDGVVSALAVVDALGGESL